MAPFLFRLRLIAEGRLRLVGRRSRGRAKRMKKPKLSNYLGALVLRWTWLLSSLAKSKCHTKVDCEKDSTSMLDSHIKLPRECVTSLIFAHILLRKECEHYPNPHISQIAPFIKRFLSPSPEVPFLSKLFVRVSKHKEHSPSPSSRHLNPSSISCAFKSNRYDLRRGTTWRVADRQLLAFDCAYGL